ncbi:hypothetical protein D1872_274190 [compost metagenome]
METKNAKTFADAHLGEQLNTDKSVAVNTQIPRRPPILSNMGLMLALSTNFAATPIMIPSTMA